MSGFLGTKTTLLVDVNLLLQVAIYLILIGGFIAQRKGNFRRHGLLMGTAALLGTVSLLMIMGPTLIGSLGGLIGGGFGLGSPLTLIHAAVGTASLAMGWVAVALLRPCGQVRQKRGIGEVKRYMFVMFLLWTLTFALGLSIYVYFYA